jgi:hypothetical protein
MHKQVIMKQKDTISVFKNLKYAVKYTFDIDGLIKIAYEILKPFPRRKDIYVKQSYFLKIIRENWQKNQIRQFSEPQVKTFILLSELNIL